MQTLDFRRIYRVADSAGSQILQSATSFFVTLSFVNCFSPSDFGIYSAGLIIWMLILSLNRSVFGEQLVVVGSGHASGFGYGAFMGSWLALLFLISLGAVWLVNAWVILPGLFFMVGFVASDAVRYWLLSSRTQSRTVLAFGMLPIELSRTVMAAMSMWFALSGNIAAALTLAPIAGFAWILLFVSCAVRWRLKDAIVYLRGRDAFEGVMLIQYFTVTGVSQLLPTVALGAFGSAAFGGLRLTQNFLAPATLLGTALQPTLLRVFGRTDHRGVNNLLLKAIGLFTVIGLTMGSISYAFFELFGRRVIPSSQYDLVAELVVPVILAIAFVVLGQPGGALIRVLRLGKISLWGQVAGIGIGSALVLLAASQNIHLMAYALAAGTASTVLVTYVLLVRELHRRACG